jgi:hypothetical protein
MSSFPQSSSAAASTALCDGQPLMIETAICRVAKANARAIRYVDTSSLKQEKYMLNKGVEA